MPSSWLMSSAGSTESHFKDRRKKYVNAQGLHFLRLCSHLIMIHCWRVLTLKRIIKYTFKLPWSIFIADLAKRDWSLIVEKAFVILWISLIWLWTAPLQILMMGIRLSYRSTYINKLNALTWNDPKIMMGWFFRY